MEEAYGPREKAYQFISYAAVTFSLVGIVSVCITLPMVYNYVSTVNSNAMQEMNFCKASVRDLYAEVASAPIRESVASNRTMSKRQAPPPEVGGGSAPCEGCCRPGPPGPGGKDGSPGKPSGDLRGPNRRSVRSLPTGTAGTTGREWATGRTRPPGTTRTGWKQRATGTSGPTRATG